MAMQTCEFGKIFDNRVNTVENDFYRISYNSRELNIDNESEYEDITFKDSNSCVSLTVNSPRIQNIDSQTDLEKILSTGVNIIKKVNKYIVEEAINPIRIGEIEGKMMTFEKSSYNANNYNLWAVGYKDGGFVSIHCSAPDKNIFEQVKDSVINLINSIEVKF